MLKKIIHTIRYRFFLFAGLVPYFLGQAISYNSIQQNFNFNYFFLGLVSIFLVLTGVETYNEYFDSRLGTDRVFELDQKEIPSYVFYIGTFSFFIAFLFAIYFYLNDRPYILIFALIGFICAAFYVGPPVRWAYRGLGEIVIAFSYGPAMTLGSYYLATGKIDKYPFFVSLIPAALVFVIAILNEIPDFYQDRLVGKKNLVVRFGKKRMAFIYLFIIALFFIFVIYGLINKKFPAILLVVLSLFPLIILGSIKFFKTYDNPKEFYKIIRINIILYLVSNFTLIIGYIL
jgi:1,4-dihydroxy-2-naphthoate octaprenyltransferase